MKSLSNEIMSPQFDTSGTNLIEASAGTGKTYSIQTLFLRLVVVKGIPVQEILVVTFTDAATKELRERLRSIIEKCRLSIESSLPDDDPDHDRIKKILSLDPEKEATVQISDSEIRQCRIKRALLDFDQAAIYTIHGFCQRSLKEFAFECGHDFDTDIVTGDTRLDKLSRDWWREINYSEPQDALEQMLKDECVKQDRLSGLVKAVVKRPNATVLPEGDADIYEIPPGVSACIAACKICQQLIAEYKIGVTKKGYTKINGIETKWNDAIKNAVEIVNENYSELINVLQNDAEFYKDNPLHEPEKRDKYIDALRSETTCGAMKSAIGNLAKLEINTGAIVNIALAKGVEFVLEKYAEEKRDAYEMTYDDLIQRLQKSLVGDNAKALKAAMKAKYKVALIDEFQDTDPVQFEVFRGIFEGLPLFYVGDPKQAIYSFRGGDIFTYGVAVDSVTDKKKYSLDKNYRSQSPLIAAINTVFKDRENPDDSIEPSSVFGTNTIRYSGDLECNDLKERFIDEGIEDTKPFKIWNYKKENSDGKSSSSSYTAPEAMSVYADVADEIVRLIKSSKTGFKKYDSEKNKCSGNITRVQPSDIAVLVKRHKEATYIYQALRKRNVAVVRQASDNVFDSQEASELLYILKAMIHPENISIIKTTLSSKLLPISDDEIVAIANDKKVENSISSELGVEDFPDTMEKWITLFKETKDLWQRKDFSTAFSRLLRKTGINANLASLPMGERRFVNLQQLHDLIHQVSVDRSFGMESIVKWFATQVNSETREENEAYETRLESDADAVKIMTLFKSKGLEFPIVFVPTMWTSVVGLTKKVCHVYHNLDENKTIVHFNKDDTVAKAASKEEGRQEEIRKLYVAATRASFRTYIVTVDFEKPKSGSVLDTCMPSDLFDEWGKDGATAIDVVDKDFGYTSKNILVNEGGENGDELQSREACVDISRGHASFSSISPHGYIVGTKPDSPDFDAVDEAVEPLIDEKKSGVDIFSFPAGARTGTCWHNIFELLDFAADDSVINDIVCRQLSLAHLDKGDDETVKAKQDITVGMVENVLKAELKAGDKTVKLSNITAKQKLAEMSFDFPLNSQGNNDKINSIRKVLEDAWRNEAEDSDERIFLNRLQSWESTIPGGFMTGSIDLMFEQGGKYYVLDWKSNRLNCTSDGFKRDGLVAEMASHSYFLQYLIYTVAVHRYLGQCIEDYDYDRHCGGVLYLFLRGIDQSGDSNTQNGIYYTKPKKDLIEKLSVALMGS